MKFIFGAVLITSLTLSAFSHAEDSVFTLQRFTWYKRLDEPLLVRALLVAGAEAGASDLQMALRFARTPEVARILLDAGAESDEELLFWVRDARMAKFYVDAGAEVNVCNRNGFSPLMCAPDGDVTEVFLAAGAEADSQKLPTSAPPEFSALHFARDAKTVRLLVSAGVPVDTLSQRHGMTPLCSARNAEVTHALMEAGADPCFTSKNGVTPLHHAQDAESVRLLLAVGADVNARNNEGRTPYFEAGSQAVRALLLEAEADPDMLDNRGKTADAQDDEDVDDDVFW